MTNETETGRTAFVTGASYGLGAAIACAFAREGYDVAVSARSRGSLDRIVSEIGATGARAIPIALDLRSEAQLTAVMTELYDACGQVDVLVNNAAMTARGPAIDISRGDWRDVMDTNLTGTFFLTQQFGRRLIEAGRNGAVVNITSTHGIVGSPDRLIYGVSKAALNHLTKMLAIEWADHGIRVNAVAPGRVLTDSPARAATAADPNYIEAMLKRIPLHRMVTPDEVAAAVLFLAGEQAGAVTGHTMVLDGGLTAQ